MATSGIAYMEILRGQKRNGVVCHILVRSDVRLRREPLNRPYHPHNLVVTNPGHNLPIERALMVL